MKTVNALTIRNQLGQVLDELQQNGEPILVSKGRKVRAVLISVEDFRTRFLDKQAEEEKKKLLESIAGLRAKKVADVSSLEALRQVRGYLE